MSRDLPRFQRSRSGRPRLIRRDRRFRLRFAFAAERGQRQNRGQNPNALRQHQVPPHSTRPIIRLPVPEYTRKFPAVFPPTQHFRPPSFPQTTPAIPPPRFFGRPIKIPHRPKPQSALAGRLTQVVFLHPFISKKLASFGARSDARFPPVFTGFQFPRTRIRLSPVLIATPKAFGIIFASTPA